MEAAAGMDTRGNTVGAMVGRLGVVVGVSSELEHLGLRSNNDVWHPIVS